MNIIPTPKKVNPDLQAAERIRIDMTIAENESFSEEIQAFSEYVERIFDFSLNIEKEGTIQIHMDESMEKEAYAIKITNEKIIVSASDSKGVNYAFSTLLQMMEIKEGNVILPAVSIWDKADRSYRGVMVDLGRAWHPFSYLLRYVDMCYFYKASVFHLHFSENESYTLPSELYPKLSTEGRHYTKEEIQYLNEYARARGVELLPEIDVPGHSECFARAYPELFGTKGVICQHHDSMVAMKELFAELCDMFPYSRYIHIGGDEAYRMDEWTKCPECLAYGKSAGIDVDMEDREKLAQIFYAHFINEMARSCKEKGRQPIVWEGFGKEANDMIDKDLIVMSWENYYHLTSDLLKAGFPVINCSWNPTYVVTENVMWKPEEIYQWTIGKWKAIHPESPILESGYETKELEAILGGQLHAWDDTIAKNPDTVSENVEQEFQNVAERLPFIVENTWNIEKIGNYEEICQSVQQHKRRMEKVKTWNFKKH